jgi:hypothetical protein
MAVSFSTLAVESFSSSPAPAISAVSTSLVMKPSSCGHVQVRSY